MKITGKHHALVRPSHTIPRGQDRAGIAGSHKEAFAVIDAEKVSGSSGIPTEPEIEWSRWSHRQLRRCACQSAESIADFDRIIARLSRLKIGQKKRGIR